jgi:hypothetical protein
MSAVIEVADNTEIEGEETNSTAAIVRRRTPDNTVDITLIRRLITVGEEDIATMIPTIETEGTTIDDATTIEEATMTIERTMNAVENGTMNTIDEEDTTAALAVTRHQTTGLLDIIVIETIGTGMVIATAEVGRETNVGGGEATIGTRKTGVGVKKSTMMTTKKEKAEPDGHGGTGMTTGMLERT